MLKKNIKLTNYLSLSRKNKLFNILINFINSKRI